MNTPCLHSVNSGFASVRSVFTVMVLASENGGNKQHVDVYIDVTSALQVVG